MNNNIFILIEGASKILYTNHSETRFDVAERIEHLIKYQIGMENTNPNLNLCISLIELGIFEELDGALPYLNKLTQTPFKEEATLLLAYGHDSFSPPVPKTLITPLSCLNFKSDTLQSCRAYLEAMALISGVANPTPGDDELVEKLLLQSIHYHPSNYASISYLYNTSHLNRLSISKTELDTIIKTAIEWRMHGTSMRANSYSTWLLDTEYFFTYSIIKTYDNRETEMAYIEKYNRMLDSKYPIF